MWIQDTQPRTLGTGTQDPSTHDPETRTWGPETRTLGLKILDLRIYKKFQLSYISCSMPKKSPLMRLITERNQFFLLFSEKHVLLLNCKIKF